MKKCKMVKKDTKLHVAKTKRGKNKANRLDRDDVTLDVKIPEEPLIKINATIKKHQVTNSISLSEDEEKFREKKIQCPNKIILDIFKYVKVKKSQPRSKPTLPIFKKRQEILDLIEQNSVVLIHGEPESGITTQVPQFILDEFIKPENRSLCKIVSTQPYKKNVTVAYEKVSEERKKYFGDSSAIRYVLRYDRHISRSAASITFCTSGVLMKRILDSSYLNEITHLIIDEIQERDVCTDFLLAFFKRIISTRTNLKLILLCTSFIANQISKYFDKCPQINVSPNLFPVDKYFLEETVMLINFNNFCKNFDKDDDESKYPNNEVPDFVKNYEKSNDLNPYLIINILKYICSENKEGNILILLPSVQSIHFIESEIKDDNTLKSITRIVKMTNPVENEIINTNRKIFLACNERNVGLVANKIMFVIDAAKIRLSFYDVITGRETLKNDWVSKNILKLRTNLAGRYKPGICFHLISEDTIQTLDKYPIPKILLTDLEEIILEIKSFGIDNAETFLQNCLTPPDSDCVKNAIEIFKANNILDDKEFLTPLGYQVSELHLKFPVGKMVILGALFSCLDPILIIASCLTFSNIFQGKYKGIQDFKQNVRITDNCDFMLVVHLLEELKTSIKDERVFLKEHFLRPSFVKDVNNITQQLKYRLTNMKFLPTKFDEKKFNVNSENINLIKALLSIALYPNIALIRNHNSDAINKITIDTVTNQPCCINSSSINYKRTVSFPSPILMYKSSSVFWRRLTLQDTSFVTPLQVLFFANNLKYSTENKDECIIDVNGSLKVNCSTSTCENIKNVQNVFNQWLENKLKFPSCVKWGKGSRKTMVLRAVLELLNKESEMKMKII